MSMLRELTMEEVGFVSGAGTTTYVDDEGTTITEYWSDDGSQFFGLTAVYPSGGGNQSSYSAGYFATVGGSMPAGFGASFSYDFTHNDAYASIEGGFGTPYTAQLGYSENIAGFLGGSSVTVTSGNPGVPVVSIDRLAVNGDTHIIGTPSAGWSYGINLGATAGDIAEWISTNWDWLSRILNDEAASATAAVADVVENGTGPRP
jgi:hypothetical protein